MTRQEIAAKIEYEGLEYFIMEYASASDMPDHELEELFCNAQDALREFMDALPDLTTRTRKRKTKTTMPDITFRWSKRENDIQVKWAAGCRATARYLMGRIFGVGIKDDLLRELDQRGYDVTTLRFSINRKKEEEDG